jgi:hypothetical protein
MGSVARWPIATHQSPCALDFRSDIIDACPFWASRFTGHSQPMAGVYARPGGRPPPFWAYAGDMGTRAQIEQLVAQATAKVPDANARIDALEKAGPPVLVALMILADAIDVLRQQVDDLSQTKSSDGSNDLTAQLSTLTSQVTKLTKTAKKVTKKKKTEKIKKKKRNKRNKRNK